jgi:2-C-methyl-D-erythritol 4-phosphate cytidylyltransferase
VSVALILAAGSGERLGAGRPKAFVELAGRPMLAWSIDALARVEGIERIVLALPAGVELPPGLDAGRPLGLAAGERLLSVEGGATRSESVRRALAAAGVPDRRRDGRDFVLVHDAARPLVTPALAADVIDALARDPAAAAAIAALPVTDTIKRVDPDGAVRETLERGELWGVQTPQVFRREALARALEVPAAELARATDDAGLVERAGGRVIVVRASAENLKVTGPLDLRVAELLLRDRPAAKNRPGTPANPA